jgi:hypothetical protein
MLHWTRIGGSLLFRLGWIDFHSISLTLDPDPIQIVDTAVFLKSHIGLRMGLCRPSGDEFYKRRVLSIGALDQQLIRVNVGLGDLVGTCGIFAFPA